MPLLIMYNDGEFGNAFGDVLVLCKGAFYVAKSPALADQSKPWKGKIVPNLDVPVRYLLSLHNYQLIFTIPEMRLEITRSYTDCNLNRTVLSA